MSSTRKIEGLARTWEEPIGIHKAAFCEGTSKVREGLGYTPATLIIGGKALTEEEVKAMLMKIRNDYHAVEDIEFIDTLAYDELGIKLP